MLAQVRSAPRPDQCTAVPSTGFGERRSHIARVESVALDLDRWLPVIAPCAMTAAEIQINFNAPASLRKWPSIRNERRTDSPYSKPYLVQDGTLIECIEELLSKPASQHPLYEIHTAPQDPWVKAVLSAQHVYELMRLRKLLAL
jgi:hypothetical protein